jgi:hypothetical protein
MWPWIKRWRDWAMYDLWSMHRTGPQPQALHHGYEKAGLAIADQPVPWNADVVVVEALLRLPAPVSRRKTDFMLRLPDRPQVHADSLRRQEHDERYRLCFRFPPPSRTVNADILWHGQRLGHLTLPIVSREDFLDRLRLQVPTLCVRMENRTVACQTFVSTQCHGLVASAIVASPTSLVPLLDLGLRVELRSERGTAFQSVPAQFNASQLCDRQALITVVPRRFPRRIGSWVATWYVADRPLASQRIRAISQRTFLRSLRISDTRFVSQSKSGRVTVARQMPALPDVDRAGPCFLVSSSEPGMAGVCDLQVRVQVSGGIQSPVVMEQETLITDGPTVVAPGTLDAAELLHINAFELLVKGTTLGTLSTSPIPIATFTGEGGFRPTADFPWTPGADEELNERLARLIEERGSQK